MVISNKVPFGKKWFKSFIDNRDSKKIRPLCIILQKRSAYRKEFDEIKCIYFWIKDNELLEEDNEILESVKNSLKNEFDSDYYPRVFLEYKNVIKEKNASGSERENSDEENSSKKKVWWKILWWRNLKAQRILAEEKK